jgi:hypothetical protein
MPAVCVGSVRSGTAGRCSATIAEVPIEQCAICGEYIEPTELDPIDVRLWSMGAQERRNKPARGGHFRAHARCLNQVVQAGAPPFPDAEAGSRLS